MSGKTPTEKKRDTSEVVAVDYDSVNQMAVDSRNHAGYLRKLGTKDEAADVSKPVDGKMVKMLEKQSAKKRKAAHQQSDKKRSKGGMFGCDIDNDSTDEDEQPETAPKKQKQQQTPAAKKPLDIEKAKRTVYVTNIPKTVESEELTSLFAKLGAVSRVDIQMRKNVSRGAAFIEMNSAEDAAKALASNGETFLGNILKVEPRSLVSDRPTAIATSSWSAGDGTSHPRTLFLKGFLQTTAREALETPLLECGPIDHFAFTSSKRGAIVEFATEEAARKALKLSGMVVNGKEVTVTPSNQGFEQWQQTKAHGNTRSWTKANATHSADPVTEQLKQQMSAISETPKPPVQKEQEKKTPPAEGLPPKEDKPKPKVASALSFRPRNVKKKV